MELKPGIQLHSQVCTTEVIVIRVGEGIADLRCGGVPMSSEAPASRGAPAFGLDGGSQLGKRYTSTADTTLEVLVTKAGDGTLSDGEHPLMLKDPKPLPSSD